MRQFKINKKIILHFIIIAMMLVVVGCNNEPSDTGNKDAENNDAENVENNDAENSGDLYAQYFAGHDSIETISYTEDAPNGEETLELIKDEEGTIMGTISEVASSGYGGPLKFTVITDSDGTILATEVLEHSESPGLGDGVEEESFRDQFVGKGVGDSFELDLDIDAISSATFTTRAFIEGVERSLSRISEHI